MKKILVIGASGLVGGRLMELGKDRYEMHGTYHNHEIKGDNMHQLDCTKPDKIAKLVSMLEPDCIIDTHSLTAVDYCETHKDEAWLINVEATRNVAEVAKMTGCKYIYFSTDYVFDGTKTKYTEKDKPNPLNYYGKTKLISEFVLQALSVNYIIVRSATIYGKDGFGKQSFVTWVTQKLKAKEKINIVTDQHSNPTFADDLVQFIFRLYDIDENGTFHVASADCMSRYAFAKLIAHTFKLDSTLITPIITAQLNQAAHRPEKVNMSTNKVARVTGIKPKTVAESLVALKEQL